MFVVIAPAARELAAHHPLASLTSIMFFLGVGAVNYPQVELGAGFDQILELPSTPPAARETYGPQREQFGELWLPPGAGPFPVVVFIHGGCWRNAYDLGHVRALATALAQAGYAVWSLEYRRLNDAGGGWPGTLDDVSAGIDRLADLAAQFPLDLQRVQVVGHSAGGHLALWAAARTDGLPVAGVVGLAAVADLASYARGRSSCQRAARELMGGLVEQWPERYARASPVLRPPPAGRVTLIHGSRDRIVSSRQADAYEQAMAAIGKAVVVVRVRGAGHFDLIHPGSPAWQRLLDALAP